MERRPRPKNAALCAAIAASGYRRADIARQAGVSVGTVSGLACRRRRPKPETARRLARVLNSTPEAFWPDLARSEDS